MCVCVCVLVRACVCVYTCFNMFFSHFSQSLAWCFGFNHNIPVHNISTDARKVAVNSGSETMSIVIYRPISA